MVLEIFSCHMGRKTSIYVVIYGSPNHLFSTYHGKQCLTKALNEEHVHVQKAYKIMGRIHLEKLSSFSLSCS